MKPMNFICHHDGCDFRGNTCDLDKHLKEKHNEDLAMWIL